MSRRRFLISLVFFLIILFVVPGVKAITPSGVFCCNSTTPGQKMCYSSGQCCLQGMADEYWDPVGCFGFKIWLEPERAAFVTGQKTPINLYIQNLGAYTDNYEITYTVPPNLALIDIKDISFVKNVGTGEIRQIRPRITVIAATLTGDVNFTVTPDYPLLSPKYVLLTILPSELPMSLPEFGFYGMTGMIILAGIIYFLIKRKH